ncbi:glycerophosphodiester phosphodiesterase [Lysinibacillus telephonicus]|uniref:glycerophosphodiester phosphodiesterase n=1 Tax=Lysinibacillus telephonicus TaxID=1714840 RepID=UPI003BA279A5
MIKRIPIFAHRGASGYTLENTMKAFEKARRLGADGIELDVQCTKDNVLVVYHDFNLFRLTGVKKNIIECTYDELSNFALGKPLIRRFSKERIPTLKQVIDWANTHKMPLNIELKESLLNNQKPLIDMLQRMVLPEGSHFSSFHDELIRIVKMQRPDFETAFIVTKAFNWNDLITSTHFDAVHANKKYYKTKYLEACTKANKGIRFYAINGTESFLFDPHPLVIGWITDFPDRVAKIEKKHK